MMESPGTFPANLSFTKIWHNKPYPMISPTRPQLSAAGKNIVITGGGTGIGKAIAIAFAQAGAASVAILGRRLGRLQAAATDIIAAGPATKVLYQIADLTKRANVDEALEKIVGEVGRINVFVSNAGILPPTKNLLDITESEFRTGFELNVIGAFNAVQSFVPLAASGAMFFNISSLIGHIPNMPSMSLYALHKMAIIKMIDYVAVENPDLHVVHVHPGIVNTEINEDQSLGQDEPELPGCFLTWLSSPEAGFLKGKLVWVNWDVEELIARSKEIQDSRLLTVQLDGVPA